jgi:hypothetical protein
VFFYWTTSPENGLLFVFVFFYERNEVGFVDILLPSEQATKAPSLLPDIVFSKTMEMEIV